MEHAASEAVDPPDQDAIVFAFEHGGHEPVEIGARPLDSGNAMIHVFVGLRPAHALEPPSQFG
jgi:hypothetical protein